MVALSSERNSNAMQALTYDNRGVAGSVNAPLGSTRTVSPGGTRRWGAPQDRVPAPAGDIRGLVGVASDDQRRGVTGPRRTGRVTRLSSRPAGRQGCGHRRRWAVARTL